MNLREGIGFSFLSPQEQKAYKVILRTFFSMSASVDCSQISCGVDLMKVIQTVLGDNPSVIYIDKTKIQIKKSILEKRIYFTVINLKPQAIKMNLSLDLTANLIASSLKMTSNDEYSLLINLYEYLQKNILYDNEELQANARGISSNPASHNAYGALLNRSAVCDGFSSAFALLAQKLGFECMLVVGSSQYVSMALVNHAWNILKTRNRYYHMDITWDARNYIEFGDFSYVYFAVTDDEISNDHDWNKTTTPNCSYSDLSYYLRNGQYADNIGQLNDIIRNCNKYPLRLKLSPNFIFPNNIEQYLYEMYAYEVAKVGEQTRIMYSWNKKTRCFFAKILN